MAERSSPERAPTLIESAIRSERIAVGLHLFTAILVCWIWIVVMALDMYGPMTGASQWMMTTSWDARHLVLLWATWAVMMTGMMLPSAAPTILLYGAAVRRIHRVAAAPAIYALAAGYLAVWALFSALADDRKH